MNRRATTKAGRAAKTIRLALHLLVLIGLLAASIGLATFAGSLWPFDMRFSTLIAAGGLAVLAIAWWPAALAFAAIAALLPRIRWRVAFWPLAVLAMAALHAVFGADRGFVPLGIIGIGGTLRLYVMSTALPILAGSALREAFSSNPALLSAARTPSPRRSSP